MKYDFAGWATKFGIRCSDGRTILHSAFADQDGAVVPLVWNHNHGDVEAIIGKAYLKHAKEGVYAYCELNDSDKAKSAKHLVQHGDISSLSIYANKLKQEGGNVKHGIIRELSLVLAGANPGASIQEVIKHGDEESDIAVIYSTEEDCELTHSDEDNEIDIEPKEPETPDNSKEPDDSETVADIYNSMNEKQKNVVAIIADQLLNEKVKEDKDDMKHNVFENKENEKDIELKHSEILGDALKEAVNRKSNSLRDTILAHAAANNIENVEELFPTETKIQNEPIVIDRDQSWVSKFLGGTTKSPFSRLKAFYADITADELRAKGYIKGSLKVEEAFALTKRTTSPTTVYKKQKIDRDDEIDITDFSVVNWMNKQLRVRVDEEIARAALIGDGRKVSDPYKVKEDKIRPVVSDSEFFTIHYAMPAGTTASNKAKEFVKACLRSRKGFEGANPSLFTSEDFLADMLLIEDANGRRIYDSEDTLCKALRVKEIITVPFLVDFQRPTTDSKFHYVDAIIMNPKDYHVGADKGGKIATFNQFDIDFNQQKYLMEVRCSGSLMKPKTAIVIETVENSARA